MSKNTPLQYITNKQAFRNNILYVDENVLIPRADTEILVECVKELVCPSDTILELCTGSGAIAISLATEVEDVSVIATDISQKALDVAIKNAKQNRVDKKIQFIQSDLFENITGEYSIIASNPPYIETGVIETLNEDVKKEPRIALDGGADGLDFYRQIAEKGYEYLKQDGYLCLEIGYNQKTAVTEILKEKYINIICKKDLSGNDRVLICQKG